MGLRAVLQNLNNVQAFHLVFAVDAGIFVSPVTQQLQTLICKCDHFLARAELQGARLAGGNTCRHHALSNTIDTARAFVDNGLAATVLVARNIVRASCRTVLATNALVLVVGDHTGLFILIQRTCGTHVYTARVGAMLTSTAAKCPANALLRLFILEVFERHNQTGAGIKVGRMGELTVPIHGIIRVFRGGLTRQVVPTLAGNLATPAASAARRIEQNSHFSHLGSPPPKP